MTQSLLNLGKELLKKVVCSLSLWTVSVLGMHAQVAVEAKIDSLQLLIGEQARIKLEVSMDAEQNLQLPLLRDTLVGGVEILDVSQPDTQRLNNNKRWLISQIYTITSFDSALYYLPPFEVQVNNETYYSKALAIKVYSIPVDTLHPDQFFGPKTICEVPMTWDDVSVMVYGFLLMILLGIVTAFFIVRYRNNKPIVKVIKMTPQLPPHQEAMQKIEEIKADKQTLRENPKQYYTELTDVIRTYIKERFGFNALEMTSSEIIECLVKENNKDSIEDLKLLFETADLVKFAKHAPMMNENDMNLLNAVDFINQTKIEEELNAKKEPTEVRVEEKRSKQGRIMLIISIIITGTGAVIALYIGICQLIELFF